MNLPQLLALFNWNSGTVEQAELELIRRAKLHNELVRELEWMLRVNDHKNSIIDYSQIRDLLKRAKGE